MNQALWIAKTGLDAQQMRMSVVSNNLANTNTTGFKQDRASFEDLLYQQVRQPGGSSSAQTQLPTGLQLGTGVRVVATAKNFEQGGQQQTGRALDVMVNGRGFFEVQMPDGSSAYTRDGSFKINQDSELVTNSGYPVQPGIQIPEGAVGHHRQRRHHQREDGRQRRVGGSRCADPDRLRQSGTCRRAARTCSWKPRPRARHRTAIPA